MTYIKEKGIALKNVENELSIATTKDKNLALKKVAESIEKNRKEILKANNKDVEIARKNNTNEALIDRLMLDNDRIDGIIEGINTVIKLQDPVWESNEVWTIENGLNISKMTTPIGVLGIVYESRPNVTVDAFSLALKSGNCIILRGSSSAINSNIELVRSIKEGLKNSNISEEAVQFIEDTNRDLVLDMLKASEYIDLIIPRGGKGLIQFVIENSTVPTLQTGEGNCHLFVDESAKLDNALDILVNAKTQRLGVCNACETLLVHEKIKEQFLPEVYKALKDKIELRGSLDIKEIINVNVAKEEDYQNEFLDAILAIKIVNDVDEAIEHINKYGTKHSESIITENLSNANKFQRKVDASTVYVNASTRFTDGSEFGFGAEMGISTQKIHARGPIGLKQLVTYKYLVMGEGQIRK
ncbi:MAG: glutamate-5-semialdehyde dehydrogenase [Tissierella sp.]|uniref:glutamate-5-semialdehyde dehydrogenase n=1 Tax=Tissierella sp. TaxID=41274 RepID=UPI003F9BA4CF